MGAHLTEPLFIQVGRRRYQIASLRQASEMFERARDAMGLGASKIGPALSVRADGTTFGYVSYNGRVWAGAPGDWQPDRTPLYDNRVPSAEIAA